MRRPRMTHTRTFVTMDLSTAAWTEIAEKMKAAGYHHVFHENREGMLIDMEGIAVRACDNEDVDDG